MTAPNSDALRMWVLGALFTAVVTMATVVYGSVNARITTIETDNKGAMASLALLSTRTALTQQTVETTQVKVDLLQQKVDTLLHDAEVARLQRTVVADQTLRDSKRLNQYLDSLQRPSRRLGQDQ